MTELNPNGDELTPNLLDRSLNSYLEQRRRSEQALSEEAWDHQVDDMVEADYVREILPARQKVWDELSMALENHPELKAEWSDEYWEGEARCGVSWVGLREQEDKTVEVTTTLMVLDWKQSDGIDRTMRLFGFRGSWLELRWAASFIKRRSDDAKPPTALGVEPNSRSRRLQYPRDEIERAVGQAIASRATKLYGSISAKELGSDGEPELLMEAFLNKRSLSQKSHFHQDGDQEVRQSKKDYLKALAVAGESEDQIEVEAPLEWQIGDGFETFLSIYEAVETSEPVVSDELGQVTDRDREAVRSRSRYRALGHIAMGTGLLGFAGGASLFTADVNRPETTVFVVGAALCFSVGRLLVNWGNFYSPSLPVIESRSSGEDASQ